MVPVQLVGSISSGSVKPDDTFQVQAAEGVVISDVVIIRQSAGGQGHTVDANSADGSGRSGSIALALDYVYSIDGGRIRLSRATQKADGRRSQRSLVDRDDRRHLDTRYRGLFGHNLALGRQDDRSGDDHQRVRSRKRALQYEPTHDRRPV